MVRRMREVEFRKEQEQHCHDEHIAPMNRYVDELLKSGSGVPYIAPMYGGVNARLLSVLRDPGPKTQDSKGSGFLCMENDDATAERICYLFAEVAIKANDIVPWNIYPWYINRAPNAAQLNEGVAPLKHIIDLMPKLRVVMLHGGSAHNGWMKFIKRYGEVDKDRGLLVIKTYHTSNQAFWHRDRTVIDDRKEHLRQSFDKAANYLRNTEPA
jgi:hypothetical protein